MEKREDDDEKKVYSTLEEKFFCTVSSGSGKNLSITFSTAKKDSLFFFSYIFFLLFLSNK